MSRWVADKTISKKGKPLLLPGYYWTVNGQKIYPETIDDEFGHVNYFIELERE